MLAERIIAESCWAFIDERSGLIAILFGENVTQVGHGDQAVGRNDDSGVVGNSLHPRPSGRSTLPLDRWPIACRHRPRTPVPHRRQRRTLSPCVRLSSVNFRVTIGRPEQLSTRPEVPPDGTQSRRSGASRSDADQVSLQYLGCHVRTIAVGIPLRIIKGDPIGADPTVRDINDLAVVVDAFGSDGGRRFIGPRARPVLSIPQDLHSGTRLQIHSLIVPHTRRTGRPYRRPVNPGLPERGNRSRNLICAVMARS